MFLKAEKGPRPAFANRLFKYGPESFLDFKASQVKEKVFSPSVAPPLPGTASISFQGLSSLCWLHAALKQLVFQPDSPPPSISYLAFCHKWKKVEELTQKIIDNIQKDVASEEWQNAVRALRITDSGSWIDVVSLVEMYGVAPATAMPDESFSLTNTLILNKYLENMLQKFAYRLHSQAQKGASPKEIGAAQKVFLEEIFEFLSHSFGCPPSFFLSGEESVNSLDFSIHHLNIRLHDYVMVTQLPKERVGDSPAFTFPTPSLLFNLSIETITASLLHMLQKRRQPVYVTIPFNGHFPFFNGLLSHETTNTGLPRVERVFYGGSTEHHALAIVNVELDENGTPTRWKLQNSWGPDHGKKGFVYATHQWLCAHFNFFVLHRDTLPPETISVLTRKDLPPLPSFVYL